MQYNFIMISKGDASWFDDQVVMSITIDTYNHLTAGWLVT